MTNKDDKAKKQTRLQAAYTALFLLTAAAAGGGCQAPMPSSY